MICVQVTCKDRAEAEKIALILLEKKLIACANIFPADSMYLWKGKIERGAEFVMFGKTLREKFAAIKKEVVHVHSYDVPFVGAWEEMTTNEIEEWMKKEL